jgi:hypothetical protein
MSLSQRHSIDENGGCVETTVLCTTRVPQPSQMAMPESGLTIVPQRRL